MGKLLLNKQALKERWGMEVSEIDIQKINETLIRVEEQLKNLATAVIALQGQVSTYYTTGHRDTPLHCAQIEVLQAKVKEMAQDAKDLEKRFDGLTTRVAVIATAIVAGGGAAFKWLPSLLGV